MLISPTGKNKNIVLHSLLKFPFAVYNLVTFTNYPVSKMGSLEKKPSLSNGIVPIEAHDFLKG